jgi:FdhD protein
MGSDRTSDVGRQTTGRTALGYSDPVVAHSFQDLEGRETSGQLAAEVPVALVYNGRPHVVMMCTPADLEDFAVGFTVTEGIAGYADIRRTDVVKYAKGIEVQLEITPAAADALASRGRQLTGRTGCGLCGVETIDEALREVAPVRSSLRVSTDAITRAGELLGAQQRLNADTHAIHAAAWCDASGEPRIVREDVGRHNALDKTIGALLREGRAAQDGFVVVTSRASYELVQKVAVANIPLLAAVSRPTALAVQLATDAGITLVGLLRGESANVYTHTERLGND